MAELPPWLTVDRDPVGTFMRAYQTGAQIRQEQTRLAEQQRQANMEAQAKQEQLQQQALLAAVQAAVDKSYNDQRIAMEQRRFDQAAIENSREASRALLDSITPKIHFGANGEVVSYNPSTRMVTVLREGNPKAVKTPTISPSMALNVTTDPLRQAFVENTYGKEGVSNLVNIAKSGFMPFKTTPSGPKAGDVEDGYRFLGGDPSKKENWTKIP